jgi:hypothetical protein
MVLEIIIAIFASTGLWTLINNLIENRRKKISAENEALLALLHDRIYFICEDYISKGTISIEEFENLEYLYKPYVKLGGNGTGERLYLEVKNLKIVGGNNSDK